MRRAAPFLFVFFVGVVSGLSTVSRPRPGAAPRALSPAPHEAPHRVTLVAPDRTVRDLTVLTGADRPANPGEWGVVLVTVRADGTRGQTRLVLEDAPPILDLAP